jgi:hypothetical protein
MCSLFLSLKILYYTFAYSPKGSTFGFLFGHNARISPFSLEPLLSKRKAKHCNTHDNVW